ncbi:hypothetical protein FJU08_09155 [Martelella alba]|uniref:DUF1344 domain-containing protein n=1 Tax=Martelella alba TaxID=2590451 RepID=A0A506UDE9_9HYPH|nr:hypothetical protein [Martelella alba]TPW30835.1 hypothetical protein FJU08_09155 [Martelella alba]
MRKLITLSVLVCAASAGTGFAGEAEPERSVAEVALEKHAKVGDLVSVEGKGIMDEDVVKTYRVGPSGTFKLVDMHDKRH